MILIILNSHGILVIISSLNTTFSIKDLGKSHLFLFIKLIPNFTKYVLSQSKYMISLLKKANMDNCKLVMSQCSTSTLIPKLNENIDPRFYQSIVGGLQYLTITRPTISFVVNCAC